MSINIVWFRQDLRVSDNPALDAAAQSGEILPVYILDTVNSGKHFLGAASQWWLHHSLIALNKTLNGNLVTFKGDPLTVLMHLAETYEVSKVFFNRCYEPWRAKRDKNIEIELEKQSIEAISCNGALLWEPWEVKKDDGTPYKVFTPFFRKGCSRAAPPRKPISPNRNLRFARLSAPAKPIARLNLTTTNGWYKKLEAEWHVGEANASAKLNHFLKNGLDGYKEGRNFPIKKNVSRLSPHLHFGEVSPNQVWYALRSLPQDKNVDHFCSELGWREFSNHLLYHFPHMLENNLQTKFDKFPWRENAEDLERWKLGQTGVPIVDAGMRELWQTGYMHNRVRMIVGSFLVKNLRIHWKYGERWFWDCLVDADLANNIAGWQWIAGTGADAAPYFRIFNPVSQGEKFDAQGEYTLRFIPELRHYPRKFLFNPWDATNDLLSSYTSQKSAEYPKPIVNLQVSRKEALAAFSSLSE